MNRKNLATLVFLLVALCAATWFFTRPEEEPADEALAQTQLPSVSVSLIPVLEPPASPSPGISMSVQKPEADPLYVFIMIGDGMGKNQRRLAQRWLELTGGGKLAMDSLPVSGEIATRSLNAKVTDSAASATAIATGYKTNNGMLSVTPEGEALKTIMEQAEKQGLSTGLVTTTRLTNATPAAFAAHNKSRSADSAIALDYLDSGIDFFAGGGAAYFLPESYAGGLDAAGATLKSSRSDGEDPLQSFKDLGYITFIGAQGAADFGDYAPSEGDMVFASFTNSNIPYEADRINELMNVPTLAGMTDKATDVLGLDEDGFVLMVEGGRIDHACHINDAKSAALEALAFDDAVKAAYSFYLEHPEDTLLIVLADHETGGLKLGDPDLSYLSGVRVSLADRAQSVYDGDREAFYKYIAQNLGLGDLNPSEKARVEKVLDKADKADPDEGYGSTVALALSKVISDRAGVSWRYTDHTDAHVPVTAIGYMSDGLSEISDNAGIGQFLFDVLASR